MTSAIAAAYTATGGAWARGPGRIYDRLAEVLVECSPVSLTGRRVIDVGAGTGAGGRAAFAAGAESVVAVDAAIGMLLHEAGTRPPAVVGDALRLPLRDGAFTGAVAAFSLNHTPDPVAGLRELARVVGPGGPIVAGAYAADDTHPVKQSVDEALADRGWAPERWYRELRASMTPLLATAARCRHAAASADLDASVHELRVPIPDLAPLDLVEWRLGMAQYASFLAGLDRAERDAIVRDALTRLGPHPSRLERSIVVIAAVTR